jgi:hypothetical protein
MAAADNWWTDEETEKLLEAIERDNRERQEWAEAYAEGLRLLGFVPDPPIMLRARIEELQRERSERQHSWSSDDMCSVCGNGRRTFQATQPCSGPRDGVG